MKVKTKEQIEYLLKITDEIGVVEHCKEDVFDYVEGWCVDDNARALQVCLRHNFGESKRLADIYFRFVKSAWIDGKLYNDLNQDLTWKKDFLINGEHTGRLLFTLGEMIDNKENEVEAKIFFDEVYSLVKNNQTKFVRVISQIILGLQYYRKTEIDYWAGQILEIYIEKKTKGWAWFEDEISYDNGRIPMALLAAYKVTGKKEYLKTAIESLEFLTEQIFNKNKDCFSFPGNKGWVTKDGVKAVYDQQPIEAGSMTEVYVLAYKITKNKKYKDLAMKAFEWYFGKNIRNEMMVNKVNGGVYDGLNDDKVNTNQGAESVLAYLIAAKDLKEIL